MERTMFKRPLLAVIVIAVLLVSLIAYGEQMIGIGYEYWNHQEDRSVSSGCITMGASTSTCALFPASQRRDTNLTSVFVNAGASGNANCAWSMQETGTLSTVGNLTTVTSAGTSAGFPLAGPGARWDTTPNAAALINAGVAGMEDGFCTEYFSQNGISFAVPCRVAGGAGATVCSNFRLGVDLGTCIAADAAHLNRAGLFAICNGVVHATIQKVRMQ